MYCWLESANNFPSCSNLSQLLISETMSKESSLIAMASHVKSSVKRVRNLRLVLIYLFICVNQSESVTSVYDSADHYWPMKNISGNISLDSISVMHAEIKNGGKLNYTKLFGPALVLDGEDDWIDLGIMGSDCTNNPSECTHGFTIAFWLYYVRGEFLLSAGEYNKADTGPGVMFTIRNKLFVIEVSTLAYTWKITSKLIAEKWVHVTFQWSPREGINLFLNGSAAQQNVFPKKKVAFPKPDNGRGWKLGRPNALVKLSEYGQIGIAHLAKWKGELQGVERQAAFFETILKDKRKMVERETKLIEKAQTTPETRVTEKLKKSKDARSTGSPLTSHPVKLWSVSLSFCAILWLF